MARHPQDIVVGQRIRVREHRGRPLYFLRGPGGSIHSLGRDHAEAQRAAARLIRDQAFDAAEQAIRVLAVYGDINPVLDALADLRTGGSTRNGGYDGASARSACREPHVAVPPHLHVAQFGIRLDCPQIAWAGQLARLTENIRAGASAIEVAKLNRMQPVLRTLGKADGDPECAEKLSGLMRHEVRL